jgi:hypothetical protein
MAVRLHDASHHRLAAPASHHPAASDAGTTEDSTYQTLPAQAATLASTPTNFTDAPLAPALNLFDPSLGTLVSVTLTQSALLQSNITSQNLSPTSSTIITAHLSGGYQLNGLNQPIVQPTQTLDSSPMPAGVFGSGSDTVTFPPLQITDTSTSVFSDAASLAFFTASPGRTTITATMTATAAGSASAPNGNLLTIAQSSASSKVTVSYTYLTPACPTVGTIGRIGVHHQRTLLIVPFQGPVNPTLAGNPHDYVVITRTGRKVPIISADYNPTTNSVTLRTARPLNVHHRFRLSVTLPCPDGIADDTVIVPFGRKTSLIGFHDKRGDFVTVHDGHIVRSDPRPRSHRPAPVRSGATRP